MQIKHADLKAYPGGSKLTLILDSPPEKLAEMVRKVNGSKNKPYKIIIEKAKTKRSLDANAYYWVLIGKLSAALHITKDALHERMLQDYGAFKLKENGKPVVFSLRADIDVKLTGIYCKEIGRGEIKGSDYIHYAVIKGSHEMTTEEFSSLLDGAIAECQDQGIETATPEELARIKESLKHVSNPTNTSYEEEQPADIEEQVQWPDVYSPEQPV